MGYGVYFYIEGICDPKEAAKDWAIMRSRGKRKKRYDEYVVLSVDILPENVWDLRHEKKQKEFNRLRKQIEKMYAREFKRTPKNQHNRLLANLAYDLLNCDAAICNLYIPNRSPKYIAKESNFPNKTVLVVRDASIIKIESLGVADEGRC